MAQPTASYTLEPDGSITFTGPVSDETRQAAYRARARQRANATHVDPSQIQQLAGHETTPREHGTEVST